MQDRYESPRIVDYGSIAEHTFGCHGSQTTAGKSGKVPPKGPEDVPHHHDVFGECSGLDAAAVS